MKRILAIILAVAMVMSMAVAVSAVDLTEAGTREIAWSLNPEAAIACGNWTKVFSYIDSPNAAFGTALYTEGAELVVEMSTFAGFQFVMQAPDSYSNLTWEFWWSGSENGTYLEEGGMAYITFDCADLTGVIAGASEAEIANINAGKLQAFVGGNGAVVENIYITVPKAEEEAPDVEPIEVSVSSPSMTSDNKNMAFNVGQTLSAGETYTVHIKGTTDTDFRIWLGTLNHNASNVVKCFMDTTEFEFIQEITTTGDASTVTLKVFNSAESDNYKDVLTGVTVTELSVFPGTKAEYEAWLAANPPVIPEEPVEETYRGAGYFMTGDETHAIIIGKAIITSNHVFDADGDCKYCGHHVDVEVDDIIVIQPTESTEEESEDITVTEPKEDTNPGTGLTLAVIPAIVALAAVVISKR